MWESRTQTRMMVAPVVAGRDCGVGAHLHASLSLSSSPAPSPPLALPLSPSFPLLLPESREIPPTKVVAVSTIIILAVK